MSTSRARPVLRDSASQRSAIELADLFMDRIPRAMAELRTEMRNEMRAHRESELSLPQFRVLAMIGTGQRSNKELADLLSVNVTTMSRMIQALEAQALVAKSAVAEDRRAVAIVLSKRGRKIFERIRTQTCEVLAVRLAKMQPQERQQLRAGLNALAKL